MKKYSIDTSNNSNTAYTNPNENPENFQRWSAENIIEYKDAVYDRISELLLLKFSQLEPHVEGTGISAIQKTYKNGSLVTGKGEDDVLVVYESDTEANADDKKIEDTILNWLNFTPPELITLTIGPPTSQITDEDSEINLNPLPNLILHVPDKDDLNINQIIGTLDLKDVNLTDNVSQFMGVNKIKTNIDRSKLSEYVDTNFSELSPVTFTHLLEKYNKLKRDIPFYRFRTEDFFDEYASTTIPTAYRLQKFFEEFQRIKDLIPAGSLANISSIDSLTEQGLFGYGTMTYLLKEARLTIDGGEIPEWSTNDVLGFTTKIGNLHTVTASMTQSITIKDDYIRQLESALAGATGSDILPSADPTQIEVEVTPPGYVQESTYFSNMGYTDLNADQTVDIEDVKLALQSGVTLPSSTDLSSIGYGCTDTNATNYDVNAEIDDGSCNYPTSDEFVITSRLTWPSIVRQHKMVTNKLLPWDEGTYIKIGDEVLKIVRKELKPYSSYNNGYVVWVNRNQDPFNQPVAFGGPTSNSIPAFHWEGTGITHFNDKIEPVFEYNFEGGQYGPGQPSQELYGQDYGLPTWSELVDNDPSITSAGASNGLNSVVKFGENPGNSEYVLEQDGSKSNEYQINIYGINPMESYTARMMVSFNESYMGRTDTQKIHIRVPGSTGNNAGGTTDIMCSLVMNNGKYYLHNLIQQCLLI